MEKTYTQPEFVLVGTDEQNNVFFADSGTPGAAPITGGSLGSMTSTMGEW